MWNAILDEIDMEIIVLFIMTLEILTFEYRFHNTLKEDEDKRIFMEEI